MYDKITTSPDDSDNEFFCKSIYNTHYFPQFKDDYIKFRQYSIFKGFYSPMKYNTSMFSYNYLKEYHPEYLLEFQNSIIENHSKFHCILL
jgi:hypothetical protein